MKKNWAHFLGGKEIKIDYDFMEAYEFLPSGLNKIKVICSQKLNPKQIITRDLWAKELILHLYPNNYNFPFCELFSQVYFIKIVTNQWPNHK